MNITSLYYFLELAENLHMTNTAEKLYISQQTLSNHIKRLEEYYDTLLFNRRPTLSLTSSGEALLSFAKNVIHREQNLKDIISDIESNEKGFLRFGASVARGMISLPEIIPKFNKHYPNVEIRYIDALSLELEQLVEKEDLDFAIILSGNPNRRLIEAPLFKDQIYLCIPDSLLMEYYGEKSKILKDKSLNGANVKDFVRLPFAMYSNRLGKLILDCFKVVGHEPIVRFTTSYSQLLIPLCLQGLSACFITQMNLSNVIEQFSEKVNIFPLYYKDEPMIQELSLIYHRDRYLPKYSKYFLNILFEYFTKLEQTQLASICK